MIDYTVTLAYPANSRLSNIAVNGTATTRPDGKVQQTVTREQLCLVVCALGGCAECDAIGKQTCDKVKR